jgi:protein ImuB
VTLLAFRVDRDVQAVTIGTGLPTRKPAHLRRLFADRLETLEPDLGFDRITLQADVTNAMTGRQEAIADGALQPEALAQLIDRLSQRLPVWRVAPGASHWPERSVVRVGPFDPVPSAAAPSGLPEPVRLLKRPLPLRVISAAPNGAPRQLRLRGKIHQVAWADGPERIEPEWWHDTPDEAARDYFRVGLESGARVWVYQCAAPEADQPALWFLHGYLA